MKSFHWLLVGLLAFGVAVGLVGYGIIFKIVRRGYSAAPPVSMLPTIEETASVSSLLLSTSTPTTTVTPTPTPGVVLPPITPGERAAHVPVLLYHYVSENPNKDDTKRDGLSTSPTIFKEQLKTMKRSGYTTVTFDELAAYFDGKSSLPSKPVILTFDDGYIDFYLNAYPILSGEGMKGVVFIPSGLIGGGAYMSWSQVEEIARSPYVVVAAHSIHHYMLTKSNENVLKNELNESKRVLEQHVGYPVNWMAYPYGAFDERVVAAAKAAGYVGAATTMPGVYQYKSRLYHISRLRAGKRSGQALLQLIE
ncbi:polysaccharide deacetylase family protein [Candidatus Gottesmanbacteria bacterium]|nr:polysaccharide deacetylase family protein [Candidatus Gottesmanbacteria bacterium]